MRTIVEDGTTYDFDTIRFGQYPTEREQAHSVNQGGPQEYWRIFKNILLYGKETDASDVEHLLAVADVVMDEK